MVIAKEFKNIAQKLINNKNVNLPIEASEIRIHFFDEESKISLNSLVYKGINYIPPSVRMCTSKQSPFPQKSIRTFLSVDENHFQIQLNYLGYVEHLTKESFKEIVEEFGFLVDKWRRYLDEHDKYDLIQVKAK